MPISQASDTFTRSNSAGSWGTASDGETWVKGAGGATLSIASNTGQMTGSTSSTTLFLGTNTTADAEALCRVSSTATGASVGLVLRAADTSNFYRVFVQGTSIKLSKTVAGATTTLTTTPVTFTASTLYWIRFRVVGSNLYLNYWQDGTGEPAGWISTATDTSLTGVGRYGMRGNGGAVGDVLTHDSYTVNKAFGLETVTETRYYGKTTLDTRARATFVQKTGLDTRARATYDTNALLDTRSRATYALKTALTTRARPRFYSRTSLQTVSRSIFKIILRICTGTQVQFRLLFSLTALAGLRATFTISKQYINTVFSKRTVMATPNTYIAVTATATDLTGAALPALATVAVTVTFPDQSTSSFSLGSGVTNAGAGVYRLNYTTKTPGLHKEDWSLVAGDGSVAEYRNITAVSF